VARFHEELALRVEEIGEFEFWLPKSQIREFVQGGRFKFLAEKVLQLMEVYIKIEKNGDLIGYLTFPDEDVLGNNIEIMDSLFDAGYVITHSTKEEYDSFNGVMNYP
jgi:hypothetical protein